MKEDTPIEDFDPELKLNPVILAKMEVERLKGFNKGKKGKKGGPVWRGGPGALARLGITLEQKKEEPPEQKRKANMRNIDVMLQKTNVDAEGTPRGVGTPTLTPHGTPPLTPRPMMTRGTGNPKATKEITRRALTYCSAQKCKHKQQFIADRMVAEAGRAQCAADHRHVARVAAKMGALQEDDEEEEDEQV